MNRKFFRRPAVLAAVIAVLMISVSAAAVLLSPSQVAEEMRTRCWQRRSRARARCC